MVILELFDIGNFLKDKKSHGRTFISFVSYKTFIGQTPLRTRFNKTVRFTRLY